MIRHTLISLEAEFFTPSCTLWVYDGCLNFSVQSLVLKKKIGCLDRLVVKDFTYQQKTVVLVDV